MIRPLASFLAVIAVAALPLAAAAQLSPGTQLIGTMDKSLSSGNAQPGETFTVSSVHSPDHNINGALIYGHVLSVQRAGQGTNGKVNLAFDKVNTRAGNIYLIQGYASNVDVQTKSNATKELLSAAGGALVGGLIGHGIGAIVGAGAGGLYAKNSRENVTIPQGSIITVQVTQSRRQATN